MATIALQSEVASENPTFDVHYAAYRRAKALWDCATYAPENLADGLPADLDHVYCSAFANALNTLLLHPVENARQFAHKMDVFKNEDIIDNWQRGPEIVAAMAEDARRLAGFK